MISTAMEKAKDFLEKLSTGDEADHVMRLTFPPHRLHLESSFYECFAYLGLRVARIQSGLVYCSFRAPPRLIDGNGNLATSAIANLIDALGAAVAYEDSSRTKNVSVDMSISYISAARLNDELETISRCLGQQGRYTGTHVVVRNKTTGEIVAEGRHSLFNLASSKM